MREGGQGSIGAISGFVIYLNKSQNKGVTIQTLLMKLNLFLDVSSLVFNHMQEIRLNTSIQLTPGDGTVRKGMEMQ